jgi:hypothetical protein
VLPPVEDGPGNAAGVLALEEQRLGLAVLEAEDLAVAADVQLTLLWRIWLELVIPSAKNHAPLQAQRRISHPGPRLASFNVGSSYRVAVGLGVGNSPSVASREMGKFVPCRGRSAGRRKNRRTFSFWRWLSIVVVGVASAEFKVPGRFSPNCGVHVVDGIGLLCDRLRCEPRARFVSVAVRRWQATSGRQLFRRRTGSSE